jgi:hypothetical protein
VAVRPDSPSIGRSEHSELDRRAPHVLSHPLTTGIWMEHQLRNTPTPWTGMDGRSCWVRSPESGLHSVDLQFIRATRKQPSRTAELSVVSR